MACSTNINNPRGGVKFAVIGLDLEDGRGAGTGAILGDDGHDVDTDNEIGLQGRLPTKSDGAA